MNTSTDALLIFLNSKLVNDSNDRKWLINETLLRMCHVITFVCAGDMSHYWLSYVCYHFLTVETVVWCFSSYSSVKTCRWDSYQQLLTSITSSKQFLLLLRYFLKYIEPWPYGLYKFSRTFGGRIKTILHGKGKNKGWIYADSSHSARLDVVLDFFFVLSPNRTNDSVLVQASLKLLWTSAVNEKYSFSSGLQDGNLYLFKNILLWCAEIWKGFETVKVLNQVKENLDW